MTESKSLLQEALAIEQHRKIKATKFTEEDYELVIAWLWGRVTLTQLCVALENRKVKPKGYSYVSRVIREMWQAGRIKD